MPLDPDFLADCPYAPEGVFLDEIIEIDQEQSRVVARMPTHDDLPLTRAQRAHPLRHPRHVAGGLMVHVTGMVGFAHAYYILGLRHRDGWVGYGARIHSARFSDLAPPGEPIEITCECTHARVRATRILARYKIRFTQAGREVYRGDQTAIWLRVAEPAEGDASG